MTETEWLITRPNYTTMSDCEEDDICCENWLFTKNINSMEWIKCIHQEYEYEGALFESKVASFLLKEPNFNDLDPCPYGQSGLCDCHNTFLMYNLGLASDCRSSRLRYARIKVEEEEIL